jgi:hypothetical protein
MGQRRRVFIAVIGLATATLFAPVLAERAAAGPADTCVLLDRVVPADASITDDSSGVGDDGACIASASFREGFYQLTIDRLDASQSLGSSPYLRARGTQQDEFDVAVGEEHRAFVDTALDDVVIQWRRQCFALEVSGELGRLTTVENATALATDIDRVLGQRSRSCPSTGTPASSTTSAPTTTSSLPGGRPLCAEARVLLEGFSTADLTAAGITDPLHTSIVRDDEALFPDLRKAIADWDRYAPDARSYATDGIEAVTNIFWVTGAKEFIPENNTRAFRRSFITGQEQSLVDALRSVTKTRRARGDTRSLTPGDVFALAIELHEGDVTEALLTAHNAMRGLSGETGVGVSDAGEELFDDELAPVRGSSNAAALAQLYGSAYLEMSVQGTWGAAISEFVFKAFSASPVFLKLLDDDFVYDKTKEVIEDQTKENAGSSLTSRITNALARYARRVHGQPLDPERFCFGVWGAQIGKELYEALPYAGTRSLRGATFSDLELPTDDDLPELGTALADSVHVNVMHSPFSVRWDGPSGTMLFDQGPSATDGTLIAGDAPVIFVPFLDDTSWGAAWFGTEALGDSVVFEAMTNDATLHFHRINTETGTTAYYEATTASAGDRFTLTIDLTDPDAPNLTAPDGTSVAPVVFDLDTRPTSVAISEDDDGSGGSSAVPVILGGIVLVAAAAVGVWWWLRRRRAPPTPESP